MNKRNNNSHPAGQVHFDRVRDLFLKLNLGPEPPRELAIPGPDGQSMMVPNPGHARWHFAMEFRMQALALGLGVFPDLRGDAPIWDWYSVALLLATEHIAYFASQPGRAREHGTPERLSAQDELLDKIMVLKAEALERTRDRLSDETAIKLLISAHHLPSYYEAKSPPLSVHSLRGELASARKRRLSQDRAILAARSKP